MREILVPETFFREGIDQHNPLITPVIRLAISWAGNVALGVCGPPLDSYDFIWATINAHPSDSGSIHPLHPPVYGV